MKALAGLPTPFEAVHVYTPASSWDDNDDHDDDGGSDDDDDGGGGGGGGGGDGDGDDGGDGDDDEGSLEYNRMLWVLLQQQPAATLISTGDCLCYITLGKNHQRMDVATWCYKCMDMGMDMGGMR